ncbi:MAG: YqeG family HAD IIIA-type phosphatase [Christensenellales bacterium]|jgi:HAD superfamily phosphatase (TIGR01668 family)
MGLRLLAPDDRCDRFWLYPPEKLEERGIRLIMLDLDNTLCPWHTLQVEPEAFDWIQKAKEMGFTVMLISNAPLRRTMEAGLLLDIPWIALAKKPWPAAIFKACKAAGIGREETVLFGDQLFTDVAAARLAGCRVVLTEPIHEREMKWTRFMRIFERRLR